jgi:type II secretory pathway predicted ATPase ExeA
LSTLEYAFAARKGISVLIGEAGTGKTTVLRSALDRQRHPDALCVVVNNPTLTRDEFVHVLADGFRLNHGAANSKAVFLQALERLLIERAAQNAPTVLVIDEAQSLPTDLLEEIRLLANIETAEQKLLSVVLAGQPELADHLRQPELRQLKQRVALRCELRPLTAAETSMYITQRIHVAGGGAVEAVFTPEALSLIHDRAQGIPRTICVICDNALVTGFATDRRPVGVQTVLEVCRDFDFGGSGVAEAATVPSFLVQTPAAPQAQPAPSRPAVHERSVLFGSAVPRRRFSFFRVRSESTS